MGEFGSGNSECGMRKEEGGKGKGQRLSIADFETKQILSIDLHFFDGIFLSSSFF
jgi:hypothetical protein